MANIDVGPMLSELGKLVAQDVRADPNGAFLYAEVGDRWVESQIFKDMGNFILFRVPSHEANMLLIDLNEAEEPDKRWSTIQYDIKDGKFFVKFGYEDVETVFDYKAGRSDALVRARFGDKPIDYSDPEGKGTRP